MHISYKGNCNTATATHHQPFAYYIFRGTKQEARGSRNAFKPRTRSIDGNGQWQAIEASCGITSVTERGFIKPPTIRPTYHSFNKPPLFRQEQHTVKHNEVHLCI